MSDKQPMGEDVEDSNLVNEDLQERIKDILEEVGWDGTCPSCEELALRLARMELDAFFKTESADNGAGEG